MASLTFLLTSNDVVCKLDIDFLENVIAPSPPFLRSRNQIMCLNLEMESYFAKYGMLHFLANLILIAICSLNIDYFWKLLMDEVSIFGVFENFDCSYLIHNFDRSYLIHNFDRSYLIHNFDRSYLIHNFDHLYLMHKDSDL